MLKLVVPSRVCCAVVLCLTTTVAYAQDHSSLATADALDAAEAFIRKEAQEGAFPGGAFALLTGGRVARTGAFGVRDLSARTPATPDTAYSIASITKPLTALAVLEAERRGLLTLDDPVVRHLPWFRLATEPSRAITLRDLLRHTSGIPTNAHAVVWRDEARIRPSLEAGVRALAAVEPTGTLGQHFEYSNMNYAVLGVVLEKVMHQPFERVIDEVVFRPSGMLSSSIGETRIPAERGAPYIPRWGTLGLGPLTPGRFLAPASGAWSTAVEMGRLAEALLGTGPAGHLAESVETSTEGAVPTGWGDEVAYGLGFAHTPIVESGLAVGHLGTSSHSSALWVLPKEGTGVVLLIGAYSPARTRSIAEGALARLQGFSPPAPVGPSDLEALLWVSRGMILTTLLSALLLLTLLWSVTRRLRLGWPPLSRASLAKAGVLSVLAPTLWWFGLDGVRRIWSALPAPVGFGMAPLQGYPEEVAAGLAGASISIAAWAVYAVVASAMARRR